MTSNIKDRATIKLSDVAIAAITFVHEHLKPSSDVGAGLVCKKL